ncbi:YTH domain-containing protein ECT4-like isoform X2 [Silene latifolia]|uniref:YTH domain-containing protein ECT4-like isoform X2 n=1 Tax=Silene latifolia TaxID=37657 RepID=UPI003D7735FD
MAAMGTPSSDAAELLQKLTLDSHTKSLDVHENPKKFGSYASRNTINSLAKPYERSAIPFQDYNSLSMYYPAGGYPYYYGGYDELSLWNDYRYLNHDGVDLHSRHLNNGMNQAGGFMGRSQLTDPTYAQYGNTYRGGSGFGLNYYNPKSWNNYRTVDNKYPSKGYNNGFFTYGNENKDTLNELSKGPRARGVKTQLGFGSVKLAVKGQDLSLKTENKEEKPSLIPDKEQYNKDDFPESFKDVRFFVIKSYSEDDIHKSIKYNVWASTPNGNKKLDAAYQEAKGKPDDCPVFLLFSVNASGQFVGLAEMVGPVDFNKSMEFWQQDKWSGCFPVKWHIVKDVPNNLLKHITLENNDNKPVTNSRDTQEVKLEQGVQVVKIFKSHLSKTSVLDDFEFYEAREKALLEKKAKKQQYQKQSKFAKNDKAAGDDKMMKSHDADAAAAAFIEGSAPEPLPNGHSNTLVDSPAEVTEGTKAEKSGVSDEVASAC